MKKRLLVLVVPLRRLLAKPRTTREVPNRCPWTKPAQLWMEVPRMTRKVSCRL
jgi:hypothetical protein